MLSRRELCHFLLTALGLATASRRAGATLAPGLSIDRLLTKSGLALPDPVVRTYRADVVVTLLGVPIFARKNVGGAVAAIREAADGQRRLVGLRFSGGANPQRTHGLKYDGSLEEVVLQDGATVPQAAYFGFVTSSANNESYDQARQRVFANQKSRDAFIAAEGLHTAGSARCEKGSITLPDAAPQDQSELNQQIRARFSDADRVGIELRTAGSAAATTFLYSVRTALRSPDARSRINYVHNAKPYQLDYERAPDPRHGANMAANGQTARPDSVARFTAHILDLSSRQTSMFRLWLDDQSDLPLRIEFQPRSYLRISLEYEPSPAKNRTEAT